MNFEAGVRAVRVGRWLAATLFAVWFGVYATIADTPIDPPRCVG
jgi:hypothetical protein